MPLGGYRGPGGTDSLNRGITESSRKQKLN